MGKSNSTKEISTGIHSTGRHSTGDYSTGDYSTGDYSTGDYSTGDYSTGDYSTGDCSTGDHSTGDRSTGCRSTGYGSTGYGSTGYSSTGDFSTGCRSTGLNSTGNYSTGSYSSGYASTGSWSISNFSTGHFSTKDYSGYGAFDKPCTPEEWDKAIKPLFIYIYPTKWIVKEKMSDGAKEAHASTYKIAGGYLREFTYKQAWRNSWEKLKKKGKTEVMYQLRILEALPNFNYEKFVQISGIDYRSEGYQLEKVKKD